MPIVNKKFYAAGALAMAATGAEAACVDFANIGGGNDFSFATAQLTLKKPDGTAIATGDGTGTNAATTSAYGTVHATCSAADPAGTTTDRFLPAGMYHGDHAFGLLVPTTDPASVIKPNIVIDCGGNNATTTAPLNVMHAIDVSGGAVGDGQPRIVTRGFGNVESELNATGGTKNPIANANVVFECIGSGHTDASTTAIGTVQTANSYKLECADSTTAPGVTNPSAVMYIDAVGNAHCYSLPTLAAGAAFTTNTAAVNTTASLVCSKTNFKTPNSKAADPNAKTLADHADDFTDTIRTFPTYKIADKGGNLIACREPKDPTVSTADLTAYNAAVKAECGAGAFFIEAEGATEATCQACPDDATCANGDITCTEGSHFKNGNTCDACPANATCTNNTHDCNTGYVAGDTVNTCVAGVAAIENFTDNSANYVTLGAKQGPARTYGTTTLSMPSTECDSQRGFYETDSWAITHATDTGRRGFRCDVCPLENCDKVVLAAGNSLARDYYFGKCHGGNHPNDATETLSRGKPAKVWELSDEVSMKTVTADRPTDNAVPNADGAPNNGRFVCADNVFNVGATAGTKTSGPEDACKGTTHTGTPIPTAATLPGALTGATDVDKQTMYDQRTKQRYYDGSSFIGCRTVTKQTAAAPTPADGVSQYTPNNSTCLPGYKPENDTITWEHDVTAGVEVYMKCVKVDVGTATCTQWSQDGDKCLEATCATGTDKVDRAATGEVIGCTNNTPAACTGIAATADAKTKTMCGYDSSLVCVDTNASGCECDVDTHYKDATTGACNALPNITTDANKACDAASAGVTGGVAAMDKNMCEPCARSVENVYEMVNNVATMKTQCAAADLVDFPVKIDTELTATEYAKLVALLPIKVQQVPLITITNLGTQTDVSPATDPVTYASSVTMKMERSLANEMTGAVALPKIVKALKAAIAAADVATLPATDKTALTTKVDAATANATPIASWPGLPTCTSGSGSGANGGSGSGSGSGNCPAAASPATCADGNFCSAGGATCSVATLFGTTAAIDTEVKAAKSAYDAIQDDADKKAFKKLTEEVCDKMEANKLCSAPASSSAFGTKPALLTALVAGVAALFF